MLAWLSGECTELQDELVRVRVRNGSLTSSPSIRINDSQKERIVSELGDVLFDTLMLEMICRRELGLEKEDAWEAAYSKVERRTPYMSVWGNNGKFSATTSEEAEEIWQIMKKLEKENPNISHLNHISTSCNKQSLFRRKFFDVLIKHIVPLIIGAMAGFAVGLNSSRISIID